MDSSEPTEAVAATSAAACSAPGRGTEGESAGSAPAPLIKREEIALDALRNACYHEDRASFFAMVHRWMMFFVVLTGSTAFVAIAGFLPDWWKAQALALAGPLGAVIGLFDLVFDPTGKARLHDRLRRESILMRADVQDCRISDGALEGALTRLYADDPPTMHAANALAYNRAMEAHGRERADLLKVGFWARKFRHIMPFDVESFPSYRDLSLAAKPK